MTMPRALAVILVTVSAFLIALAWAITQTDPGDRE